MATKPKVKPTRSQEAEILLRPEVIGQLAESIPGFDRAGLLASIIESFGGQDKLGAVIVTEFTHAPIGSLVRQRILDMVCRMLSQHSNAEALRPVEEMSTDEIHAAILSMVPALANVGVGISREGG